MEHFQMLQKNISSRKVVVLIGSTRFFNHFFEEAWRITNEDHSIVILPNFRPDNMMSKEFDVDEEILEDIGYSKIDFCDEVVVVNYDNYIGSSTRREIEYAKSIGKPIRYLF